MYYPLNLFVFENAFDEWQICQKISVTRSRSRSIRLFQIFNFFFCQLYIEGSHDIVELLNFGKPNNRAGNILLGVNPSHGNSCIALAVFFGELFDTIDYNFIACLLDIGQQLSKQNISIVTSSLLFFPVSSPIARGE